MLVCSFFLPLLFVTQQLRLGVIAANMNIKVELFQANVITNNNDMTKIMWISLGALGIKILLLLYTLPFKIFNDPYKLWGRTYLCRPTFWRWACKREVDEENENHHDWRKAIFFWRENDNNEMQ